jgi:hypothetical protein
MSDLTINITVDAFVFNPAVCNAKHSRIVPITQPNHTNLSLEREKVQAAVLPRHELQYSLPKDINPRVIDVATGKVRENRLGVYLHWVLPTVYRTAQMSAPSSFSPFNDATIKEKPIQNRWLIIRRIEPDSVVPKVVVLEVEA